MKKRILSIVAVIALIAIAVSATAAIQNKKMNDLATAYDSELETAKAVAETLQTELDTASEHTAELETAVADAEALRTELENTYAAELETAKANEETLQSRLQMLEAERQSVRDMLIDQIKRVDYQDRAVYVIGHRSPDSDTVGAAIGMAYLLNSLGIPAEARTTGDLNLETGYAFSTMNYPAPEIMEDAAGQQLWLVDHSAATQMVEGAEDARIVGIVDHHGIGSAETSEPICVLSCPAGSTCSIVCELYEACGVDMPKDIAGVLLAGVLSDTSNMKSNAVTLLDEAAFAKLKPLSGISDTDALFNGMLEAMLSYEGLEDREIYYSDYKDYERNGIRYGIGCVKVAHLEDIPEMAERMQKVIEAETANGNETDLLIYHVYDPDYSMGYLGFSGKDMTFAKEIMEGTFGDKAQMQGGYYVFTPSLSRKKAIVPPIDAYLDTVQLAENID